MPEDLLKPDETDPDWPKRTDDTFESPFDEEDIVEVEDEDE